MNKTERPNATPQDAQHEAQQATDELFESVLNEAVADVLEHFDGMGIPEAGEQQRTDLADEIKAALSEALSHWCT